MEQCTNKFYTQILLNGQLAAFLQGNKRWLFDHLIKLACAFVPLYLTYMY